MTSTLCVSRVAAQDTTMKVSPSSLQISGSQIGQTVQVTIEVENVANLWQWVTGLVWDPAVFNLTGIQEGPFLKSAGSTFYLVAPADYDNGILPEVSSTLLSTASVDGSGVLATVTFEVLAAEPTTIQLTDTSLTESGTGHPEISHVVVNGDVTVVEPSPSPSPTPTPTPTPSPSPSASPTPTPTSSPSATPTPTSTSSPTPAPPAEDAPFDFYLIAAVGVVIVGIIVAALILKKKS